MAGFDAGTCVKLITAATSHCSVAAAPVAAPIVQTVREPNWEGVTTSLTALSTALAFGLLVVAVIALIASIGFAIFVRQWAKNEARTVAEEWLEREGRSILREHESLLNPDDGTPSSDAANKEADDLGKNA